MSGHYVDVVLAWLHIFSSIGWMGAAMFFTMVMGPLMVRLSPQAKGELALKLIPKFTKYMSMFGILTMAFGTILAFSHAGGNLSVFSPSSTWGLNLSAGALLTIVSFALALTVATPTAKKVVRLISEFQRNPQGPPPAEIPKLQKRLGTSGLTILILLTLVLVFMVAATRF